MGERNLNFDEIVSRKGTKCLKYDFAKERGYAEDILPLWVADMDFRTSSYIEDALVKQAEHAIYGYTEVDDEYFEAVQTWISGHYEWEVKKEWLHKSPGVVFAIANAVRAFTRPEEAILIQQPVYYPFSGVIRDNGRKIVSNDLKYDGSVYTIDFEDFEKKIIENNVKLFIMCNPHNPVGRVWSRDELLKIGRICQKHNVIVFSDEIHADFIWKKKHISFASIDPSFEDIAIVATSPSKTFNIAGLQVSNILIPNEEIYERFAKEYDASGYSQLNSAGIIAAEAAYRHGEEWYLAMKKYVASNIEYTKTYVNEKLPGIKMIEPEGTYLVWLDFSGLNLCPKEIEELVVKKAKLWLDSGAIFGKAGAGFQRINVACPRQILKEALDRLKNAVDEL